jgi:hypothetical protein
MATPDDFLLALRPVLERVRTSDSAVKFPDGGTAWRGDEPLTKSRVFEHLNGTLGRGACPINFGESTTRLLLLDFDSHQGESTWMQMVEVGQRVADELERDGVRMTFFRSSGGSGLHGISLWETPQDAYSVRQLAVAALARAGLKNGTGGVNKGEVEVFPKQDSLPPLPTDRLAADGQEVKVNRGSMFVLPMFRKSEPVDMLLGCGLGREAALSLEWPMSSPVATVVRSEREQGLVTGEPPDSISKVISALAAIPNDGLIADLGYDQWFPIVCAVSEATGASSDGLEAVNDWSAQNPKHDATFLRRNVWPHIRSVDERGGKGFTRATLYKAARDAGWTWAGEITDDGFEDVPVVLRGLAQSAVGSTHVAGRAGEVVGMALDADRATPIALLGNALPGITDADDGELPGFQRNKIGEIHPIARNLLLALARPALCGLRIAYDQFRDELMCAAPGTEGWRQFRDADYVTIRVELETGGIGFKPISKDLLREVVQAIAEAFKFDSAQYWLRRLKWDGVPRVAQFLSRYLRVADTPYHRAVSLYHWTGQAGRVLAPGTKADMAMIWTGPQGKMKSSAIAAMVPDIQFFCEIGFSEAESDLARKMRGKLVAEIAELRGLHTRDNEHIKSFMSRPVEIWTPKYKEFTTSYARRLMFIGTSNEDEILADKTGNRRWLPVKAHHDIDLDGIVADRDQLWAEAAVLFGRGGVAWREAQRLAPTEHEAFEVRDSWEDVIRDWLDTDDGMSPRHADLPLLRVHDVLVKALRLDIGKVTRKEELRCANILKGFGYERKKVWQSGRPIWAFVLTEKGKG